VSYTTAEQLVRNVDGAIIDRAKAAAEQIAAVRRLSAQPPISVRGLGAPVRKKRRSRLN
jgi:hypothetical protein